MKKLFVFAALVGVALTGCVNNEEVNVPKEQNQVTFQVAKYLPGTRAEVAYSTDLAFGAFAYYQNSTTQGEHTSFMNNVKVRHYPAENIWAADGSKIYYWPIEGHLDFICYSPYNEDATSAAVPKILDTDTQQTLRYDAFTVDAANPVDIMYSDKAMQQTANTQNYGFVGVPTLFHHALAKLNFMVKTVRLDNKDASPDNVTSWKVTVHKITIDNIYNKGDLILKTTNDHTSARLVEWNNTITAHNYNTWMPNVSSTTSKTWEYDQLLTMEARTYGAGVENAELAQNYYVLPQLITTSQQRISIEYTVVATAPSGQEGTEKHTVSKFLADNSLIAAWECGKSITYTLEIDPIGDEIHFAPQVVDWEAVSGSVSF